MMDAINNDAVVMREIVQGPDSGWETSVSCSSFFFGSLSLS